MAIKCPCMDCNTRELYCHATCDLYLNWCSERNKAKSNDLANGELNSYTIEVKTAVKYRRRKKTRRK